VIGESISHYRILDRLGTGGMGEVYLAEDQRLHRLAALKIAPSDEACSRLLREARVASALSHPAIAVIYDVGEEEHAGRRWAYIAMEYVKGPTLAELARGGPLAIDDVLDKVGQIADALVEAHAAGVIHRDVKPSNVMVAENGRVKVLDFGLAKHVPVVDEAASTRSGWDRELARPGSVMGTIAYMPPEQALGRDVDGRADVFSLGVLLYELLAGRLPFTGANAVELFDAVLHAEPPRLLRGAEPVDPDLEAIVLRMLAKDRERRYPSMAALRADLDAYRSGVRGMRRPAAAGVAVMSFANITRGVEDDWLGTGIAETLTADLKGAVGLAVISRDSIHEVLSKLGGSESEEGRATELGRAVGARFVVSGGYQRVGALVRLTARITDVDSGAATGSVKLDGTMQEIFALQDRLVAKLASGLAASAPSTPLDVGETQVVEAFEAFSRGVINLRAETHESLDRAIHFFERAIALDPNYAQAHLRLGDAKSLKAAYLGLPELLEEALTSLRRALELRPTHAASWYETGAVLVHLGRQQEGIAAIERGLALDPGDAAAHAALARAYFLGCGDFARAALEYERTLALNPHAGWSALQLAHCAALLGDFPRGETAARRAIALQEGGQSGKAGLVIVGAYIRLGHLWALQERHAEAKQQFEREQQFLSHVDHALKARVFIELHTRMAAAQLLLGEPQAAETALEMALEAFERRVRMGSDEPFTRYYAACAYALRGDPEAALTCLGEAIARLPEFNRARARIEPHLASLRNDPRFQSLVLLGSFTRPGAFSSE
jgi:TolB-like protein/tetratricopeptide (TPR) repeat protein/predicted Ser/Thr protein kinase